MENMFGTILQWWVAIRKNWCGCRRHWNSAREFPPTIEWRRTRDSEREIELNPFKINPLLDYEFIWKWYKEEYWNPFTSTTTQLKKNDEWKWSFKILFQINFLSSKSVNFLFLKLEKKKNRRKKLLPLNDKVPEILFLLIRKGKFYFFK